MDTPLLRDGKGRAAWIEYAACVFESSSSGGSRTSWARRKTRRSWCDGARVEDLFARYGERYPELAAFRGSVVASVNQNFADWRSPLAAGDEVAFLPPVSGGSETSGVALVQDLIELVRQPIRVSEIVALLKAPGRWRRGGVRRHRAQPLRGAPHAVSGL